MNEILANGSTDCVSENVLNELNIIINSVPSDLNDLEKVRFIYKKLGYLFSFDYRKALKEYQNIENNIDFNKYVGRYQTCIELSKILNYVFSKIGIKSKTIARKNPNIRESFQEDHVANEVLVDNSGYQMKLLLDLSLDLYNIQSGLETMHFGYEDDGTGTYDIISQSESRELDQKLGFKTQYTSEIVKRFEEIKLNKANLPIEQALNEALEIIKTMYHKFNGYQEARQYMNMLFSKILPVNYKDFNLFYLENGKINFKTVYKLEHDSFERWFIYSNEYGLIETNLENIKEMLNSGWITNSKTLPNIVNTNQK